MGNLNGTVLGNVRLKGDYWLLETVLDRDLPAPQPGRFLMFKVSGTTDPLLRRPFGIHDFLRDGDGRCILKILYRVCGRGTSLMTRFTPGEPVDLLGPLGRGFDPPEGKDRPVIVAGGIGGAPLLYLARTLVERGRRPLVFAGGNTDDDVLAERQFRELGCDVHLATMDGTAGFKGTVVDCLLGRCGDGSLAFYACGPWPMLGRLARECRERGWPMQATVDSPMACGMGLCLGCAVRGGGDRSYRLVCKEGPVFGLHDLDWERPS